MWPRVWQAACTPDHVAAPGDFFEYRVGPYSVVIVRGDDGELRAFQNVCRHRGNSLCNGSGSGLTELRCGYHKWAWDLRGRLREVPSRKGFGVLRNDDYPLFEARVDTWGPLVFVNLDLDAMPLAEYLEAVPDDTAWVGLEDFRCVAAVTSPVRANWKVIVDGFSETYHVQGLHPEMLGSIDDIDAPQKVWGHTSKSEQDYGVPSPRFRGGLPDEDVWSSFIVTQGSRMGVEEPCALPDLEPGQTVQDVIARRIRETQAAAGVDLSRFDTAQIMRMHQYNLFPNATVLVTPDLLSVLIGRPGAPPDDAEFVAFHYRRAPSAGEPRSKPVDVVLPADQLDMGLVLNADVRVLEGMQRGLHQPGLTHLTLSGEECRVINTHRNLDRYLAQP
ncbi:MAG: aromatic ring-hydroxylating dioxygenase subunit alpha [Actinobacteria bacterium]|nr:aromatic ring-hydroxylating dioxygenase subunit alpha [Actinomycetota bacterium]